MVTYNVETEVTERFLDQAVLVSSSQYKIYMLSSFELFLQNQWIRPSWTFSPDNRKMLIRYDVTSIFRHSIVASYAVYNIDTGYE